MMTCCQTMWTCELSEEFYRAKEALRRAEREQNPEEVAACKARLDEISSQLIEVAPSEPSRRR